MSDTSSNNTLKKQKKIIVIIMVSMAIFIAAYYIIASINWEALFDKFSNESDPSDNNYIYFYDEDLSVNIFQDEHYMALDRSINFSKNNWSSTIDDQDAVAEGPAVNLIYNMLGYILSGNHEGYNSCFSTEYYKYASPVGRFTQQKIYNIIITEI